MIGEKPQARKRLPGTSVLSKDQIPGDRDDPNPRFFSNKLFHPTALGDFIRINKGVGPSEGFKRLRPVPDVFESLGRDKHLRPRARCVGLNESQRHGAACQAVKTGFGFPVFLPKEPGVILSSVLFLLPQSLVRLPSMVEARCLHHQLMYLDAK